MIERLRQRLESTRPGRWWDLPAACLLLAALYITASRLVITEWTDHLNIVRLLTLLGVLAGLALGQSLFSAYWAGIFTLAYGSFAIPWLFGLTLTRVSDDALWSERALNLVLRLMNSFTRLARQDALDDPLLFVFCMAVLSWVLGAYAGYTLTRHARPWQALLPAGLALLILQTYDPLFASRVWFLAAYLLFALMLLARLIYLRRRAYWKQERVFLPTYAGTDFGRVTLQVTVLLVLLSWVTPVLASAFSPAQRAWRDVSRPWLSIQDRLDNVVSALREQAGGVYNIYGDSLFLDSGEVLSQEIALVVEVPANAPTPPRYYWRARVYNHYDAGQWVTTILSETQRITPERFTLTFPPLNQSEDRQWTAAFTVTTASPISTLFIPAQPVWISQPGKADVAHNPDGTVEMSAFHANPPVRAGGVYEVHSSFNDVTVAQLRAAGVDYPTWVTARYLQLAPDVTPRFYDLARQITLEMDNPYDKAAAITSYLRTFIRYSETLSSPPPLNRDPVEWFLFDAREGYCSYYAAAEVILLRTLGIPARVAVGYAEGERESGSDIYLYGGDGTSLWPEDSGLYVVRESDSHAWPEVYFPGLGWVEFEPTAARPPIYRPLGDDELGIAEDSLFDLDADQRERWEERMEELEIMVPVDELSEPVVPSVGPPPVVWVLLLVSGVGLLLIALVLRKHGSRIFAPVPVLVQKGLRRFDLQPPAVLHRWLVYATSPLLSRAYQEINYALVRLGASPHPADTPAERALALGRLLPEAAKPARSLLAEYHAMAYGTRPGNLGIAQRAGRSIRELSWRAALRRIAARVRQAVIRDRG
jgi:transglutaminase-like putative cysteine protease